MCQATQVVDVTSIATLNVQQNSQGFPKKRKSRSTILELLVLVFGSTVFVWPSTPNVSQLTMNFIIIIILFGGLAVCKNESLRGYVSNRGIFC